MPTVKIIRVDFAEILSKLHLSWKLIYGFTKRMMLNILIAASYAGKGMHYLYANILVAQIIFVKLASQLNFWLIISLRPSLDLLNVPTWMLTCGFIPDINHIHATTAAKLFHRKGTWKSIDGFTRVKNHLCANSVVSVLITIQFKPRSNVKFDELFPYG